MPDSITGNSTSIRGLPIVMPAVVLGPWSDRAICVGEDPNLFFPSYGDFGIVARQVCAGCPVRLDCIEYAVDADEFGIWGGLDQEQRRKLVRGRPESA